MSNPKSPDPKKRRSNETSFQPAWKRARELPDFLDASASVSASTFGARRLPEIKALYKVAVQSGKPVRPEESLKSSGGKTSSRHLRRRVTSHQSRKRHRYPEGNHEKNDSTVLVKSSSRKTQRQHKSILCHSHESWWRTETNTDHPTTDTPIHWMMTHLWHAKRFHMADLWGWQVPMVHNNRGPKAALRLIREGKTLLQDGTWQSRPLVMRGTSTNNIQTALRRLCPDFNIPTTTSEITSGQGMTYALDQFPLNAIGPVRWLVSKDGPLLWNDTNATISDRKESGYYVYFWVHPAIQNSIEEELEALKDSLETSPTPSTVGLSHFKLRGIHATTTLRKVLAEKDVSSSSNQRVMENDQLHTELSDGSAIWITVSLNGEGNRILLISHCVREASNLPQNAPAMGWDVYCNVAIAGSFFVELTVKGQACPIGVVEESYIHLECDPPIANVFPRDFPETEEGRKYWEAKHDEDHGDSMTLRLCLEEGEAGGRVPVPIIKIRARDAKPQLDQLTTRVSALRLGKIDWGTLVQPGTTSTDEEHDESSSNGDSVVDVVMMKGVFGRPLLDALAGSGKIGSPLLAEAGHKSSRSRKRRRVRNQNELCHVSPLNRKEAEAHLKICNTLLQSLSLPAVVACQVQIIGKGSLKPGAQIHAIKDRGTSLFLGHVTAGSFSVARGCSHGIGVVGASFLLQAIIVAFSKAQNSSKALAVVNGNLTRQLRLVVRIKTDSWSGKALLALVL